MCCFLDLSKTCFRDLRGIKIKIKGKTSKRLYEKMQNILKKILFKKKEFPDFILMINV